MRHPAKSVDAHDSRSPFGRERMLANLSGRGIGVNDGGPGKDAQMLRPDIKPHQQDIAGQHGEYTLKARLCVEHGFENSVERPARIAFLVDCLDTQHSGDVQRRPVPRSWRALERRRR